MEIQASAFEACFTLSNYADQYRLEVTNFGNFMQLSGKDGYGGVERAVTGTAYVTSANHVRIGFLKFSNTATATDVIFNVDLSLSTLSGPYTAYRPAFGDRISGTMSLVSCSGIPDLRNLPNSGDQ